MDVPMPAATAVLKTAQAEQQPRSPFELQRLGWLQPRAPVGGGTGARDRRIPLAGTDRPRRVGSNPRGIGVLGAGRQARREYAGGRRIRTRTGSGRRDFLLGFPTRVALRSGAALPPGARPRRRHWPL